MSPNATATALDIRHVVVPLDGSSLAAAALPTARAVASQFGADVSTISVAADPAPGITEELARRPGALLVMSTRAHGRLAGAVLGSVAGDILASTDAPFLAVGPQADRPGWLTGRPRRRPSPFPDPLSVGAIVVLVDGTAADEAALPVAAAWAGALDRDLVVLTVAEDAPAGFDGTIPNRFGPKDPRRHVDAIAERWRAEVPKVCSEVVRDPLGVASGVRSYLAEHQVALLVVAATRRTGLERLRLGATAADIVRSATAPALIVPVRQRDDSPAGSTSPPDDRLVQGNTR